MRAHDQHGQFLLVGAGRMGRPYIEAARGLGYAVQVVESESWTAADLPPGVDLARIAGAGPDSWTVDEVWPGEAYKAAARGGIGGALAFAEPQVIAAALIQDLLGIEGPSLHAAVLSRNKALQRACFEARDLPQPESIVVTDIDRAVAWAQSRMPVVIKPLSSTGSAGVELVADPLALSATLRARAADGRVLLEHAVTGQEYSWEGLLRRGEIVFSNFTEKETTGPPQFVEIAHRCGYAFTDDKVAERVDAMVAGVVAALGMRTGVMHLEFRLTGDGPVIMEVAVRTPGDFVFDLLARTYQFNPYAAVVSLAMGGQVQLPAGQRPRAYAAVWYPVSSPGEVTDVVGLYEVRRQPFVVDARMMVHAGDLVEPLESSRQRIGRVLFEAPTSSELDRAMAAARATLHVSTRS